VGLPI